MGAELARVRFFVEALKSGDSSYPKIKLVPVSYTHLTLPTIYSV